MVEGLEPSFSVFRSPYNKLWCEAGVPRLADSHRGEIEIVDVAFDDLVEM